MRPLWIWLAALGLYAAFSFWYDSWSPPLSPAEIDEHLARLQRGPEPPEPERLAALREFLEADDGGEFFMANLVRTAPGPVRDPASGEQRAAPDVLRDYTGHFMPALLRRAGHPAFLGRAAGGYVEHWGVEPDPGWTLVGVIRYRSRRDMIELVTDPRFAPAHAFKLAALSHTLAFPVSPGRVVLGPRLVAPLLLGLVAALGHLALRR